MKQIVEAFPIREGAQHIVTNSWKVLSRRYRLGWRRTCQQMRWSPKRMMDPNPIQKISASTAREVVVINPSWIPIVNWKQAITFVDLELLFYQCICNIYFPSISPVKSIYNYPQETLNYWSSGSLAGSVAFPVVSSWYAGNKLYLVSVKLHWETFNTSITNYEVRNLKIWNWLWYRAFFWHWFSSFRHPVFTVYTSIILSFNIFIMGRWGFPMV